MEKRTMRNLKFYSVKEEQDLAKQLDKLQLKKKQAALQHDRAQSAFMKRYSALLQRKNGGLAHQRKNVTQTRAEDFVVSGAKISEKFDTRVPSRTEQISLSAVYEENVSVGRGGVTDVQAISFSKPPTSMPVNHQSNQLSLRSRILSRSAPATRYVDAELPTIREVRRFPRSSANTDIHYGVHGRYRVSEPDGEHRVRKAWSPDLKVSSYRHAATEGRDFDSVPSSSFIDAISSTDCQQIRGILIKKNAYSFKFCGNNIDELQREIMTSSRRRSSDPCNNTQIREQMRRSGLKKHVTFLESQIAGHEADGENPPRNLSGRFKGLNIVTLMADVDESNFIQHELGRGAPKVFVP